MLNEHEKGAGERARSSVAVVPILLSFREGNEMVDESTCAICRGRSATAGRGISAAMSDRWAFEAIGHDLGVRRIFADGGSALGPPLLEQYGDAGARSTGFYWR